MGFINYYAKKIGCTVLTHVCVINRSQSINQSSLFPDQHVQKYKKVQFTVIHVQGSHVHLIEHLTCNSNFTN